MRILQIIYESKGSPFGVGGAGARAYEIWGRLLHRHEITMLCMKYKGAKDREILGLTHVFVGAESPSLARSVLAYTCKAASYVRRHGHEFDVIVENFLPTTPFFSCFLTRTPVVLQVQGVMYGHAIKKFSPLYSLPICVVERFYPGLHSRFIFVSDVTRRKVLKRGGKAGTALVIPNGIDAGLLGAEPSDGDYILFLSRIDVYTKGLDLLMPAFAQVAEMHPEVKLVLAGYEFDSAEKLMQRLPKNMRDRVSYAGFVEGEEKTALIAGARLFVLPSRHESSPISVLEAAACAKAVLVSDIPELGYAQEEGFGQSFESGSVKSLAKGLDMLLSNPDMRARMGLRGRAFASSLLWDGIALRFEDVLKEMTTDKKKAID